MRRLALGCAGGRRLRQRELRLCHACDNAVARRRARSDVDTGGLLALQGRGGIFYAEPTGRATKLRDVAGFDVAALHDGFVNPARPLQWAPFRRRRIATGDSDSAADEKPYRQAFHDDPPLREVYAGAVTPDAQLPPAETSIDIALVRVLLKEQHPDLAALPLADAGEGWDNRMFRLGDDLVVRLPRRAIAAPLIEQEHRWLPILAPRLPLAIPSPLRVGRASCGFPWSWSVTPWLPGETALVADFDQHQAALDVAGFLRALQQPAPDDAPRSAWRGVPLDARDALFRKDLALAAERVDQSAVIDTWERLRATTPWKGPALWIHGDLHPDNVVVRDGRVSGVLDFGDLAAGDPAMDLSVAWMLLQGEARSTFYELTCGIDGWLDHDAWLRGRAWALAIGVAYIAHAGMDGSSGAIASAAIDAAVSNPKP